MIMISHDGVGRDINRKQVCEFFGARDNPAASVLNLLIALRENSTFEDCSFVGGLPKHQSFMSVLKLDQLVRFKYPSGATVIISLC